MATYGTKSKWSSQQIQKQFKNKHRNDFDNDWSLKSNHSTPFVNACNAYHKNIYTNYNNEDELFMDEENDEVYWTCHNCTYENTERDSYCIICESPLKSSHHTNATQCLTLADHLPSDLDTMVHFENDMDQLLQFAIMNSFSDHSANDTHSQYYGATIESKPTKEQIRRDKRKKQKQQRQQKMRQKQSAQLRKQRQEQRLVQAKKTEQRKFLSKCTEKCPKISTVIGENIVSVIRKNIDEQYRGHKSFSIRFILNYDVLLNFVSSQDLDSNNWEFVYHGTDSRNAEGIIRQGLIVGGTKGVRVAHGSCHGRGVYCSPKTGTAKGYEKGSMFICIVRDTKVRRCGSIWVVPSETDILPLYLVSFTAKRESVNGKPVWPYFPVSDALKDLLKSKTDGLISVAVNDDGLNQQMLKFIPSFGFLNEKHGMSRKIKRKWSAYHKLNENI